MTENQDLYAGISQGSEAALDRVRSHPGELDGVGPMGVGPVLHAAYHQHSDLAAAIAALRPGGPTLHEAAGIGNADDLRAAVDHAGGHLNSRSGDGFTAVHLAAFFGHTECLTLLLDAGASPDVAATNPSAVRPLHAALVQPRADVVRQLLDAGVDVDARQTGGYTALHSAYRRGDAEIIELLLAAGADPEARADDGQRPADMAVH